MKKTLLAAAFALSASAAIAGGLDDPEVEAPVMPADVVAADAASSGNMDFLIPLFFVLMWVTLS